MNRVHIFTVVLLFSALLLIAYAYFGLMRHHRDVKLDTSPIEEILAGQAAEAEAEEEEEQPAILYTKEEPLDIYNSGGGRGPGAR